MKLVGQVQHDADDQVKKLLQDPPMSRSTLILMPTHGIILNQNGGPNRAKVNVLPFGGACFKEKLIVRGAILPADYYNIQRLISCGPILTASGVVTGTVIEGPRTAPSGRARRCPCVSERPSMWTRSWRRFEDCTCARSEMPMS